MPNYNISFNDELGQIVDAQIKEGKYSSTSEFFRNLVRQRYVNDEDDRCDSEVVSLTDSDATLVQDRKRDASFIPLNTLLQR